MVSELRRFGPYVSEETYRAAVAKANGEGPLAKAAE